MEGKILASGLISGKDGNRYIFELNQIQNAIGYDIDELVGKEVDFQIMQNSAISIYVISPLEKRDVKNVEAHIATALDSSHIVESTPQVNDIAQEQHIDTQNIAAPEQIKSIKRYAYAMAILAIVPSLLILFIIVLGGLH